MPSTRSETPAHQSIRPSRHPLPADLPPRSLPDLVAGHDAYGALRAVDQRRGHSYQSALRALLNGVSGVIVRTLVVLLLCVFPWPPLSMI